MFKTIRYWVIKTVGISKGEANALLVLVPTLLMIIIIPPFFHHSFTNQYSNHTTDQAILDSLLAQIAANGQELLHSKIAKQPIVHTSFDPNTAPQDLLKSNGIPDYLAKRIINYRNKGGSFSMKEDLQKIYGMEEELYESLIPYINIPKSQKQIISNPTYTSYTEKFKIAPFDINSADTSTFKQIRGIGSKLSFRLVNFRDKLGGFINPNQLYQVYGLESEVVDSLLGYGSISNNFAPAQLNINTDTILHLSQHPYIDYRLSKAIINYRIQHGSYSQLAQLKNIHLMNDSLYNKISPYLKTSE